MDDRQYEYGVEQEDCAEHIDISHDNDRLLAVPSETLQRLQLVVKQRNR